MTLTSLPPLRPLTLAELLDQAIRLYRRNFLTLIAIVALVYAPGALMQLGITAFTTSDLLAYQASQRTFSRSVFDIPMGYWLNLGGNLAVTFLNLILVSGVGTAAVTRAVADNYLGVPISVSSAYRNIAGRWGKLVQVLLVSFILTIGLGLWMMIPCVGWLSGPGMMAFYALVMTPLFAAIVVLEGRGPTATIRRAWDLSRRRFWWLVGFGLILALFSLLVISGPTALATLILQTVLGGLFEQASNPTTAAILQALISQTVTVVLSLIYLPLQDVCYTLLYFDLRVRTEGLDLALQTAPVPEVGFPTPAASTMTDLLAQAPPPEARGWFTRDDFVSFLGLTMGTVGVWVIFYFIAIALGLAIMGLSNAF